ncbi:ATP-dependent helicase HrpB [endosymbiont of Ridgeia piscesae]|jgi:ATP-dependent helicase HrpB|uniref:ATP-dependent helicase HrpB n=1 Tax=endosymbiont of Ridgeia piscesae TaxID=54398 RepID=A0A0T5Z5N6_9GAMM|nr:ATP-dependent helicase HrpB [endosymbiont of Ridgeia piscesae]KRT54921.1 ATP-dependent helicase HrpB [endosymbiont of Ridgeia piscesae]KRT58218.1 ATP-dependent helicase HrpB [endosymbiont of Ridgeia piscesae]
MSELPIESVIDALRCCLADGSRAVLSAPPGSGKTTLVPLRLLDEPWLAGQKILLLEPRRLAARAAAARMADLLGERVGETVGYRIHLDTKVSRRTRIEVVTEGVLTRLLQRDPELSGIGLLIFDEFHERSLHADLSLALALDVQGALREELRLLVMSATLDATAVSELLEGAPLVVGEGTCYPVELHYLGDPPRGRRIAEAVAAAVLQLLPQESGDLLLFLPGIGEIRRTLSLLQQRLGNDSEVMLCPLYGDLDRAAQDRAIQPDPGGRQRVVLATSIAETSLTIEGVSAVLDSGYSRRPRFLPGLGLTRLETLPVSRAAADQRAGRAGRLGPGRCYRLWGESRHASLPAQHLAEIREADLAPLAMELAQWGIQAPDDLRWLDPPPAAAYAQARDLLIRLGGLDRQGRLTAIGKQMAALPLHPRLAHMVLCAGSSADRSLACDLAALLSERDLLRTGAGARQVDVDLRLALLEQWRRRHRKGAELDAAASSRVDRSSRHWQRLLGEWRGMQSAGVSGTAALLAMAYPDRIAQRTGHGRFRLTSGRGALLSENDPLAAAPFIVAVQLDAGRTEGRVMLAAEITEAEIRALPGVELELRERIEWDTAQQAVVCTEEERLGALVLSMRVLERPDAEAVRRAMLEGIRQLGLAALPWNDKLRQWLARVDCLRAAAPNQEWPDLSEARLVATLEVWLAPWLDGISRRSQLQKIDLHGALLSLLSWDQQRELDRLAPTHLQVPSGSRIPLYYEMGKAPVLAVRLQEMFGLGETPSLCGGRVQLMLHLLSPAQRPIQVTQDLRGFWERTYADVKKELKGRYPKHYWPDDPWSAAATARAKPRRSR